MDSLDLLGRMQVIVEELKRFPTEEEMTAIPYWSALLGEIRQAYQGLSSFIRQNPLSVQETVPFPNADQEETVAQILEKPRILIRDAAGTGKTAPAVKAKYALEQLVYGNRVLGLVVCPGYVASSWKEKIAEYTGERAVVETVTSRNRQDQMAALTKRLAKGDIPDFLIVSYDAIFRELPEETDSLAEFDHPAEVPEFLEADTLASRLLDYVSRASSPLYLVLDEPQHIKNPAAFRSRAVRELALEADHLAALSGTIFPDSLDDIYELMSLFDSDRYRTARDAELLYQDDPRLIRLFLHRYGKHPVLAIAEEEIPVVQDVADVTLSPEERAVYDRIVESPLGTEKYILLRLAATDARLVDPRTYRGSRSVQEKLREIFPGEEDFFGRLGDPSRYRELDRQVERALADGGKVVIFSQFREGIIDELAVRYGRFGVARIDGSVSSEPSGVFSPRDVQRLEFQTCPEIRIMIATRGSLREGHDLHAANRVICLHQDISPGYNDQALGRVARKGQLRPVHATTLVADGTIDRGVQMMELEKRGAIRMVDKGLSLTPEQRELLQRGGMETPQLRDYLMNPHIMLKRMIGHMTGRGGSWNSSYLAIGGNARLYADAYAYQWETSYSGQTARLVRALISDLDPALSDVSAIIDLASGPAIVTRVTGIKSTCVDLNRYQLEYGKRQAARRGIAVDAFIGDVEDLQSLGIPDGRFDLAVLSLALHYGTREGGRKRMVLEANRVLRPGGSFILTVPDGYVDRGEIGQLERGLEALGFSPVEGRHGIARALDSTDRDFSVYAALCTKAADPPRGVASNSLYDDLFALRRQTAISLPSPARQAPPPAPPRKDICSLFQFEDGDVIGNPGAGAAARVETVLPPDKEQLVAPPNALVESPELVLQHLRRLTNKGRRDHDS